jgi:sugar O-acyltransferase (sialic acid O-acetyltransferase NeuD family)
MSLKDIAIVGAGGLGKEIAVLIHQINQEELTWNVIGFYDDAVPIGNKVAGHLVLGQIEDLSKIDYKLNAVVAVGDPVIKAKIVSEIANPQISFPVLIHPTAGVGLGIELGAGTIITAGCQLTIDIKTGAHVLINLNSTIGHDVSIGKFACIMPGVHLSGFVILEDHVLIGTGASVLQHLRIGSGARVGDGAIVTKDVDSHSTVKGIPAKK